MEQKIIVPVSTKINFLSLHFYFRKGQLPPKNINLAHHLPLIIPSFRRPSSPWLIFLGGVPRLSRERKGLVSKKGRKLGEPSSKVRISWDICGFR